MIQKFLWFLFLILFESSLAQQVADTTFNPPIAQPAYTAGRGPVVMLDEAHFNFHTATGRYLPFAQLLRRDGYVVQASTSLFNKESLRQGKILVITNALAEVNQGNWALPNPSAFADDEIAAVREWVREGGALLLIADHMPFAGAAEKLGVAFGIRFSNCFAMFAEQSRGSLFVFRRSNGALVDHPITNGRTRDERIDSLITFTGSALQVDAGAQPLLMLDSSQVLLLPETAWQFKPETLGGRYITAEDLGTSTADMDIVRLETKHVAGLAARSGDPSPWTAHGVFRAMQAAAQYRWHSDHLAGKTVALQGCGNVGYCLAKALHAAGAKLTVTDIAAERVQRVVNEFGATVVRPEAIYHVAADVFAPCALGAVLNDETIPQLQVEIIAGAANNQLREAKHGATLQERGILYVPDYLANAGGVINGCIEMLNWEPAQAMDKVNAIYDAALDIFTLAQEQGIATSEAADRLAEQRLLRKL